MLTSLYLTYLTARKDVGSVMTEVPMVKEVPVEETPPEPGEQ
jgi:hypothetical protein